MPDLDLTITIPEARVSGLYDALCTPPAEGADPLGRRVLGEDFDAICANGWGDRRTGKAVARRMMRRFLGDLRRQYVAEQQDAQRQAALDADDADGMTTADDD